jgi:hypothetical protein
MKRIEYNSKLKTIVVLKQHYNEDINNRLL